MMRSPSSVNYETRPCKYVERRILLSSFNAIINRVDKDYQYIGFGGLAFTDFKLFHKELGINRMYSIEACYKPDKIEFNKPYSCITILHDLSKQALARIDLSTPSIVWLDYDGSLNMYMFSDLEYLFSRLPVGSIYVLSCRSEMKNKDGLTYSREDMDEVFKGLVPFDVENDCCAEAHRCYTIKRMIDGYCDKILAERSDLGESVKYKSLYNYRYSDGAEMFTTGGVIIGEDITDEFIEKCKTEFIGNEITDILLPILTHRETLRLNQILGNSAAEQELIAKGIIDLKQIESYKRFYKYMPNFYDVRF